MTSTITTCVSTRDSPGNTGGYFGGGGDRRGEGGDGKGDTGGGDDGDGKKAQVDRPTNDSLHCVLASIVHVLEQPSPSAVFPSSHCSRALRAPSPQTPAHRGFHSPPKHAMQRGA